jgi:hypothetical protein
MNCSDGISVQALRQRMQWMTQQIDELRELQERVRAAETKRSGPDLRSASGVKLATRGSAAPKSGSRNPVSREAKLP